jgi:hypothetical protein
MREPTRLALLLVLLLAGPALAQPPAWSLQQNSPDPFCGSTAPTIIQFSMGQSARVVLEVWNEDMSVVVRTLIDADLVAGSHQVVWDGRDDASMPLPDGTYPYVLTAMQTGGSDILFQDTRDAHISCAVAAESRSWSALKATYR